MRLGFAIREYRLKSGMTQGGLSALAGMSQTYLSLVELDKKTPSLELLYKISSALSVPVYCLFFKGIEIDVDIVAEKRDAYKKFSPVVDSMIESFFMQT